VIPQSLLRVVDDFEEIGDAQPFFLLATYELQLSVKVGTVFSWLS
jgi:hypothetical protein